MADPARPSKDEAAAQEQQAPKATPVFYTNSLSIVVGLYDFTLVFGHKVGPEEASRDMAVVMSPQHAAAAHLVLSKYLKAYQEKFGKISLPDDLVNRLDKVEKVEDNVEQSHA